MYILSILQHSKTMTRKHVRQNGPFFAHRTKGAGTFEFAINSTKSFSLCSNQQQYHVNLTWYNVVYPCSNTYIQSNRGLYHLIQPQPTSFNLDQASLKSFWHFVLPRRAFPVIVSLRLILITNLLLSWLISHRQVKFMHN